jgi:hypothetical protein
VICDYGTIMTSHTGPVIELLPDLCLLVEHKGHVIHRKLSLNSSDPNNDKTFRTYSRLKSLCLVLKKYNLKDTNSSTTNSGVFFRLFFCVQLKFDIITPHVSSIMFYFCYFYFEDF